MRYNRNHFLPEETKFHHHHCHRHQNYDQWRRYGGLGDLSPSPTCRQDQVSNSSKFDEKMSGLG